MRDEYLALSALNEYIETRCGANKIIHDVAPYHSIAILS
jgi:hypothetical protein